MLRIDPQPGEKMTNRNTLGGIIHTYQKYDPVNLPAPTQPPPDLVSPAMEHMLMFGDARRLTDAYGNVALPRIVAMRGSDSYHGDDWIGLKMRDASVVRGIGVLPIFAGLIGLLLLIGSLAATWAREGR